MHLYLLTSLRRRPQYDVNCGFVIRAESEEQARYFASQRAADEGSDTWLESNHSTCEVLTQHGEPCIILTDFNAG